MSQAPNPPPLQPNPYQDAAHYQYMLDQKARNYSLWSLILGIASIVLVFSGILGIIGIAAGVVGLILGGKARKMLPEGQRGMATAGFVCSIVGLGICAIGVVIALIAFMGIASLATFAG